MSSPLFPALAAFVGGGLLAIALTVPYVAWSYRNRGELGSGHVAIALVTTVYAVALFTYTLIPFPASDWCARHTVVPQLAPLQFLSDIQAEQVGTGPVALLRNPAMLQIAFNVALFVPLGMVARYVFRRGFAVTVLIGLATSLLLELTQLTGVWGLAACTYRLFDVDDLLVNTLGAALGFAVAPLLRMVPGQRVTLAPDQPRPVTGRRRALGMLLDVLLFTLLGAVLQVAANGVWFLLVDGGVDGGSAPAALTPYLTGVVPALVVLGAAMSSQGATPGQRAVRLRPTLPDGRAPGARPIILRWAVGLGGFALLATIDLLPELLGLVSVIMAWIPRDHRGLSGVVAGLRVRDARSTSGSRVGEAAEPIP